MTISTALQPSGTHPTRAQGAAPQSTFPPGRRSPVGDPSTLPPARRPGDRRPTARRIARLLLPAAEAAGGFTSTELVVRLPGSSDPHQPDVALVVADVPVDGQVHRPPELVAVVEPTPGEADVAGSWLGMGVEVVWRVLDEAVEVWTRSAVTLRTRGQTVTVPLGRDERGEPLPLSEVAVNALLGLR